jgi:GntR family transcriptional regulator of arabinose operon
MIAFGISKTAPLPLHVQLLDDLRHKVLTGVLKPHERLPGEWELCQQLEISRATIQKAWHSAEEEGLIYRIPGKGTFVAEPAGPTSVRVVVGLVLPDFRSSSAAQLLRGTERVLRKRGYRVEVACTEYSVQEENRVLRQMYDDGVSGCIVWAVKGTGDRLIGRPPRSIPMVLIDRPVPLLHLPCVTSNNYAGGMQAMDHLIGLGHRRIAFLARPHLDLWTVAERYRAYCDALTRIGETPAKPLLIGDEHELSSYDAYQADDVGLLDPLIARLKQPDHPTAIFAVNDWMAIRVLRAAAAAGIRVPEELSLVGFDNLDVGKYLTPPLTTVAQDTNGMGAEAAHRLLDLIEGEATQEILTLLPTELIVRGSTAQNA